MPVEKFADLHRPQPNRIAAVHDAAAKAIHSACVAREAEIANMDNTISRLTKAFRGNRKFTAAEVSRILFALNQFGTAVHTGRDNSLRHMNTALRCDLPTAKLIAQAEDYAALGAKIAILHQVANASVMAEEGGDDLLQVDKAGYTVDGGAGDVMDDLPQAGGPAPMAPPAPAPAPTAPPAPVQGGMSMGGDMDTMLGPEGDGGAEAGMSMGEAPAPAAPAAPAPGGFNQLPPAPVSAARRRSAADTGYERYDVNAGENEKEPVGTPQDGGKSRTRKGEDPWKPPFVRSDIPLPDQTMAENEKLPVGVPKEFGKGGKPGDTYSRTDPGTKPPSNTLARRRQADLPEFLQDKHQDEEGCHGSLESDAGIESEANGASQNPITNDVSKTEPSFPSVSKRKTATPTDANGEPGDTYSREDPGTVEKNVKAVLIARKAYEAALKAAGFDSPLPMEAPKQEPLPEVRSQVPDQDVLSDKSGMEMGGMEMGAFENTPEDFGEPPMPEEGAFGAEEPEFGGNPNELEINQPGGDIDQAIQSDILGDDFGGQEQAPGEESAPPAMPTGMMANRGKLTAKAARRATASSHTAAASTGDDMLTAVIYDEFC